VCFSGTHHVIIDEKAALVQLSSARISPCCLFRFGIDCVDKLEWRGWAPGGEYSKVLNVRNISTKTIRFKYRLPRNKQFSMGFPEPVQLRPGLCCPLRVTFRPVKEEPQADSIRIECAGTAFTIQVAALTPEIKLKLPAQLDFGYCAVNEVCGT
jgi:cilia- and flagella-associated protein 65